MNINKILTILSDENVSQESLFRLVDKIKNLNLNDDDNLREIIGEVGKISNREITPEVEEYLVEKIRNEGIPTDIFNLFQ